MFDHVTIRASDREASERFYDTVLRTLAIERTNSGDDYTEWDDFSLAQANADKPVTRRLHIAFVAPSRAEVDEFWRVGTAAGYRDDGAPGPRTQYGDEYYGGFLLDPDGNSAEAVHHGSMRTAGNVDHLWIRVADVAASKRFYELVAAHGGFGCAGICPSARSSSVPAAPARSCSVAQPSRSTWRSPRARTRPSTPSIERARTPGTETTALPASARPTTAATTPRSSSIPTGTTSRS